MRQLLKKATSRWSVTNDTETTRRRKSAKKLPPKAPSKDKIITLKFPEKTSEAQLVAINNHILIMGSWKNRRCIAYKPPNNGNYKTTNNNTINSNGKFKEIETTGTSRVRQKSLFQTMKDNLSHKKSNDFKMTFTKEEKSQIYDRYVSKIAAEMSEMIGFYVKFV